MVELRSGEILIAVRANNLARMYYKQEFHTSLDDDLEAMLSKDKDDITQIILNADLDMDAIFELDKIINNSNNSKAAEQEIMTKLKKLNIPIDTLIKKMTKKKRSAWPPFESAKIVWAMAKAQAKKDNKDIPNFEQWLVEYGDFDVNDCMKDFEKEVASGFFRSEAL